MSAMPQPLTAEEFARRYGGEAVELVDGKVEPVPMATVPHGRACASAIGHFGGFVDDNGLGLVCSNDTFVVVGRNPDRVRGADVCYWHKDRVPPGDLPDILPDPPDLVVEVRSPSERWPDTFGKIVEFLTVGVRVVVLIDPLTRTTTVYSQDDPPAVLKPADTLTLPSVLPGFAVPVAEFFA